MMSHCKSTCFKHVFINKKYALLYKNQINIYFTMYPVRLTVISRMNKIILQIEQKALYEKLIFVCKI